MNNKSNILKSCCPTIHLIFMFLLLINVQASAQTPPVPTIEGVNNSQQIYLGNGYCLSATLDGSEGPTPPARALTCFGYRAQRWRLDFTGSTRGPGFLIRPVTSTSQCLGIDPLTKFDLVSGAIFHSNVKLVPCNSVSAFQRWTMVPVLDPFSDPRTTYYTFQNVGLAARAVLSLPPDSISDGSLQLKMEIFQAGSPQSMQTQIWKSEEIYCILGYGQHAYGYSHMVWSNGQYSSESWDPSCK